jgi:hypothetical protein
MGERNDNREGKDKNRKGIYQKKGKELKVQKGKKKGREGLRDEDMEVMIFPKKLTVHTLKD